MRVIAGEKKGFPLKTPRGNNTRPTSDKIKGAIFNSLANYINFYDKKAIDCFAGSGSLGIEFLSRGGSHCTFIEQSQQSLACVKENIQKTGYVKNSLVKKGNAITYLTSLDEPYDLFFIDPPYNKELAQKSIDIITKDELLTESGALVVETDKDESLEFCTSYLKIVTEKKYGDTKITTFVRS